MVTSVYDRAERYAGLIGKMQSVLGAVARELAERPSPRAAALSVEIDDVLKEAASLFDEQFDEQSKPISGKS